MPPSRPLACGRTVRPEGGTPDAARIRATPTLDSTGGRDDLLQVPCGRHQQAGVGDTYVADAVVFLDGGVIVEEGPPRAIFSTPQRDRTKKFIASLSAPHDYEI